MEIILLKEHFNWNKVYCSVSLDRVIASKPDMHFFRKIPT